MSDVTNVILSYSVLDGDALPRVNAFFGATRGFLPVRDDSVGGTKALEAPLAIGAFNHLNVEALVDHVRQLEWKDRASVQLFTKGQEEEKFSLIHPCESDLGSLIGQVYEGHVIKSRSGLTFERCGPYGYRPIPTHGFEGLSWKDRPQIRVIAVDHPAQEMRVEIVKRRLTTGCN